MTEVKFLTTKWPESKAGNSFTGRVWVKNIGNISALSRASCGTVVNYALWKIYFSITGRWNTRRIIIFYAVFASRSQKVKILMTSLKLDVEGHAFCHCRGRSTWDPLYQLLPILTTLDIINLSGKFAPAREHFRNGEVNMPLWSLKFL